MEHLRETELFRLITTGGSIALTSEDVVEAFNKFESELFSLNNKYESRIEHYRVISSAIVEFETIAPQKKRGNRVIATQSPLAA